MSITPEERVRRRRSLRLHIIVALFTFVVGAFFVHETHQTKIHQEV